MGLSGATRRENLKKEQYEFQLDTAYGGGLVQRRGHLDPLSSTAEVSESLGLIKPEEFVMETANLDHKIEDMARSLRLDHLANSKVEEKARLAREEVRKFKEAEQRRARKREQEARNPQRKVALRLENKRRFEAEELKDPGIPMIKLEVNSCKSRETVSLVDVRMLRARCKMMDEGHNVRQMLDTDKQKEKQERCNNYMRSLRHHHSSPEFSTFDSVSSYPLSEQSYEQRLERVKAQQQMKQVEEVLRKYKLSRSKLPYSLPYRIEVRDNEVDGSPRLNIICPNGGGHAVAGKDAQAMAEKLSCNSPAGSHHLVDPMEVHKLLSDHGRSSKPHPFHRRRRSSVASKRNRDDANRALAQRTRLLQLWATLRAAAKVLALYAVVVRRQSSIQVVKNLLQELGEWARMRRSIRRLMSSIKILQATCRHFQESKKRRCEQIQKEWCRVEDHHLVAYFRTYSQKIIKEMKDQAGHVPALQQRPILKSVGGHANRILSTTKAKDVISWMEAGIESGDVSVKWKDYRIPQKDRWAMICAFYKMRLKKHVRSQDSFLAAVKARVDTEKEMVEFLKKFGATEMAVREFQQSNVQEAIVTPPSFWYMSEETALQLIALAAQSLVNEKPFQDHPANKDLPDTKHRSSSRLLPSEDPENAASGVAGALSKASVLLRYFERPDNTVSLGRLARRQERQERRSEVGVEAKEETTTRANSKVSIEDLFTRFTPRLREIADVQAVKARTSGGNRPSREEIDRVDIDDGPLIVSARG